MKTSEEEDKNFDLITGSLNDWSEMLELFSKASGLIASIYLTTGQRIIGPYCGSGFGEYLLSTGIFESEGKGSTFESGLALKNSKSKDFALTYFKDALFLRSVPIKIEQHILGCVVFGWAFDHFPDPVEANKLAQTFGQAESSFWQASRIQSPTGQDKAKTYEAMLSLLCSTLIQQLVSLRQAKLNARLKDELLAVVSHELKTPLTSILLRVQILKRGKLNPGRLHEVASLLENSALIQARLIDDLLDAAKVITGKFTISKTKTNLSETLQSALETVEESAHKKQIKLLTQGLDLVLPFNGDPFRLQQAFCNILSNSIKFTPPGGKITVKVTQNISNYVIEFTDNGPGIEPAFMPFLFKKFSQHESKIGQSNAGLGLGLSLVKIIIELHQGHVEVESPGKGRGVTFEITLPRENLSRNVG